MVIKTNRFHEENGSAHVLATLEEYIDPILKLSRGAVFGIRSHPIEQFANLSIGHSLSFSPFAFERELV